MKRSCGYIFLFLSLLLSLSGCSSRRVATVSGGHVTADSVLLVPSATREVEYLACSMKMSASVNEECSTAKGKLRIRAGEGIQLSATAMGLMEAACFEFLPHSVRFIYKIDKIYADAPYAGVPFLDRTGTDYRILESVILNRMFSPDGIPFEKALDGMSVADEGGYVTVTTSRKAAVVYKFYLDKNSGNLVRSEGSYANGGNVVCRYADFVDFDGLPFPQTVELSFKGEGVSAALTLRMSNLKNGVFTFSPRRVSGAYQRFSLEAILGSMGNMD